MRESVLVVAPHADDELLGCGGAILRHKRLGDRVDWLLVTCIPTIHGEANDVALSREKEISEISSRLGFDATHQLKFPTTELDQQPLSKLVERIGRVVNEVKPSIVYVPFPGDAHTDHGVVFSAAASCTKWFRHQSITSVRAYETLSETNFGISPVENAFKPNMYIDITEHLQEKLDAMAVYNNETGPHPFPRSSDAISALACLRGSECGTEAAEAFMALREIIK